MAGRPNASGRERTRQERTYGEKQVAAALAAWVRTGSLKAAASETGVPWETIREWAGHAKWKRLLSEVRRAHAEEIKGLWSASARDAAEGLQEAVLRCRQGLRRPGLKDRDAALIGRTFAIVLSMAQRAGEHDEPEDRGPRVVRVYRGMAVPREPDDLEGVEEESG